MDLRNKGFKHGRRIARGCNQIRVHNVHIRRRTECHADHTVRVVRVVFAEPAKRNRLAALVMVRVKEVFNALAQRVVLVLHRDIVPVAQRGVGRRHIHVAAGILNIIY